MFLITFFVIMLAFSCGVSYMFNYLVDGTGSSTGGVFTYFFWVLLQVIQTTFNIIKLKLFKVFFKQNGPLIHAKFFLNIASNVGILENIFF
jgi:hypothetical protein